MAAYFKYMRRVTELMGAEGEEVDRQLRNIWEVGVEIANVRIPANCLCFPESHFHSYSDWSGDRYKVTR